MKRIRRLYWIAAAVMMALGFPYEGAGEFATTLSYYFFLGIIFLYAAPKVLRIGASSKSSRFCGGRLQNSLIGGLQQGASRAVTDFIAGGGSSEKRGRAPRVNDAYARKKEADRRVFERTRATNDAIWQENRARRYAGTADGWRAHNRALAAREKAKRL